MFKNGLCLHNLCFQPIAYYFLTLFFNAEKTQICKDVYN